MGKGKFCTTLLVAVLLGVLLPGAAYADEANLLYTIGTADPGLSGGTLGWQPFDGTRTYTSSGWLWIGFELPDVGADGVVSIRASKTGQPRFDYSGYYATTAAKYDSDGNRTALSFPPATEDVIEKLEPAGIYTLRLRFNVTPETSFVYFSVYVTGSRFSRTYVYGADSNCIYTPSGAGLPAPTLDPEPPATPGTTNEVSWTAIAAEATHSQVQCATDADFSNIVSDSGPIAVPTATHEFTDLTIGETYYYRARVLGQSATPAVESGWSNVESSQQVPPPKPDVQISLLSYTGFVGDDIYNDTGENQTVERTIGVGPYAYYYVKVQNEGGVAAPFTLHATPGTRSLYSGTGWRVICYNSYPQDVTSQMTGSGYTINMAAGGVYSCHFLVQSDATVPGGDVKDVFFTATAENGSSDTALAKTTNANVYRPDLLISGGGSFVGDDIYNPSGYNQSALQTVPAGTAATYDLKLQNDGNTTDSFVITAPAAPAGWDLKVFDAAAGGTDVTAAVTGAGWTVSDLPRYGEQAFRAEVTSDGTGADTWDVVILATSVGDAAARDAVKATTRALAAPVMHEPDFRVGTICDVSWSSISALATHSQVECIHPGGATTSSPLIPVPTATHQFIDMVPGETCQVRARVTDGTVYSPWSNVVEFVQLDPQPVLVYTGDTEIYQGVSPTLAARLTSAGEPLADVTVDFTVDGTTVSAVTDADGVAGVLLEKRLLPARTYTVYCYSHAYGPFLPAECTGSLTVLPSIGPVVLEGRGWYRDDATGSRCNVNFRFRNGSLGGHLAFVDTRNGVNIHATGVSSVGLNGPDEATVTGSCEVNGAAANFTLTANQATNEFSLETTLGYSTGLQTLNGSIEIAQ